MDAAKTMNSNYIC